MKKTDLNALMDAIIPGKRVLILFQRDGYMDVLNECKEFTIYDFWQDPNELSSLNLLTASKPILLRGDLYPFGEHGREHLSKRVQFMITTFNKWRLYSQTNQLPLILLTYGYVSDTPSDRLEVYGGTVMKQNFDEIVYVWENNVRIYSDYADRLGSRKIRTWADLINAFQLEKSYLDALKP